MFTVVQAEHVEMESEEDLSLEQRFHSFHREVVRFEEELLEVESEVPLVTPDYVKSVMGFNFYSNINDLVVTSRRLDALTLEDVKTENILTTVDLTRLVRTLRTSLGLPVEFMMRVGELAKRWAFMCMEVKLHDPPLTLMSHTTLRFRPALYGASSAEPPEERGAKFTLALPKFFEVEFSSTIRSTVTHQPTLVRLTDEGAEVLAKGSVIVPEQKLDPALQAILDSARM